MNIMRQILHVHKNTSESLRLGIMLAIVGGFLDAYTFVGRDGVFANAQTGNIVMLAVNAAKADWRQAAIQIPPILAFIAGVFVAEILRKSVTRRLLYDYSRAILVIETAILILIGFIPSSVPNLVVTVTISFVASLQVSTFRKLIDAPYATTMVTGNLRSASQAAYLAFSQKDAEAAIRSIRYFTIIFFFIVGAILGGWMTYKIGDRAVWGATLFLAGSFILFTKEERARHRQNASRTVSL